MATGEANQEPEAQLTKDVVAQCKEFTLYPVAYGKPGINLSRVVI